MNKSTRNTSAPIWATGFTLLASRQELGKEPEYCAWEGSSKEPIPVPVKAIRNSQLDPCTNITAVAFTAAEIKRWVAN